MVEHQDRINLFVVSGAGAHLVALPALVGAGSSARRASMASDDEACDAVIFGAPSHASHFAPRPFVSLETLCNLTKVWHFGALCCIGGAAVKQVCRLHNGTDSGCFSKWSLPGLMQSSWAAQTATVAHRICRAPRAGAVSPCAAVSGWCRPSSAAAAPRSCRPGRLHSRTPKLRRLQGRTPDPKSRTQRPLLHPQTSAGANPCPQLTQKRQQHR